MEKLRIRMKTKPRIVFLYKNNDKVLFLRNKLNGRLTPGPDYKKFASEHGMENH